ncbi:DUF1254 domain-containing protein [Falsiroseomonas sp. E2-1-a20]|uniref:DUF1254 domain-containing protein n=1 Tax=Falsiroseomonas sp. E2-1-a20 TaxID=3239300 RepID=UPI003F2DD503
MVSRRHLLTSAAICSIANSGLLAEKAIAQNGGTLASPEEVRRIAEAGYIFGLPIVTNYGVMYEYAVDRSSANFKAPFNEIKSEPRVFTYQDTAIVTPNSDTPYSILWMDLRAEPIILSVPAVELGRYYSVQLVDGNTYNYGYIGTRATGTEPGHYMVIAPDWQGETPPGIKQVFRSSTAFSFVAYRTQLFAADDMPNVVAVQNEYRVQTLSAYLQRPVPVVAPAIAFPRINAALARSNFFEYLDFAMQFGPPAANEAEIRADLARIGVGPGKTFAFRDLPSEHKQEVVRGMQAGHAKVAEAVATAGTSINGWRVSSLLGSAAFFNGDWLRRAAGAQAGIYGNDAEEATYPLTRHDADGEPLDGSKFNYTLTFAAGETPPVNAFWSVTMYDGRTQLLIQNPINRYLINSPMTATMTKGADGSLTLYIQNKSPGGDRDANWLPAPDGPIYLVMRLYWPKDTPPSILPVGQGTWRPPGIKRMPL